MANGPGKYDDVCTVVRETTEARVVVMIVLDGNKGSGFSVQSTQGDVTTRLPGLLRLTAQMIEGKYD